jgi:hypothetical protein
MRAEIVNHTSAVLERIEPLLNEDGVLRENVRSLARYFLDLTEPMTTHAREGVKSIDKEPPLPLVIEEMSIESPALTSDSEPEAAEIKLRPVDFSGASPFALTAESYRSLVTVDADLPLIEKRLRLKAEAARWSASRRRKLADGADFYVDIKPVDRDLIDRANQLPDCYLWMNRQSCPSPSDLTLLDDLGGCFEATADAVRLVRAVLNNDHSLDGFIGTAFELLAEAQSAIRASIINLAAKQEADQYKVFQWLRTELFDRQIYLSRYMKTDDNAKPEEWTDLAARIQTIDFQIQERTQRSKQHHADLNRIRFHLKPVSQHAEDQRKHHWDSIVQTVNEMVEGGLPPSNIDLRELLLPVADDLPIKDLPDGFVRVLREMDRYLASRPPVQDSHSSPNLSPAVTQVAKTLKNTTLIVIGGERRQYNCDALKRAFGLKEVDWIEAPHQESPTVFEPNVANSNVRVVVLAIRWSSHGFGDVIQYCEKYGKCFVRLTGGYNPNQIAAQIMHQCGKRLGIGE